MLCTKPRFDNEVKSDLEMAYWKAFLGVQKYHFSVQTEGQTRKKGKFYIPLVFTYGFCSVKLLFCFMQCSSVLAVLSLEHFLLVFTDADQFFDHGDVSFNLVVHQRDLLVLFLCFAD